MTFSQSSTKPIAAQRERDAEHARALSVRVARQARNATTSRATISRPPIVGVPCFVLWPSGPSSRMFWPTLRARRKRMNAGPPTTR